MNKQIRLKVTDIYLDKENPRHGPLRDQPEIIAHLCKEDRVKAIASDIAKYGLSPIEMPAVFQDSTEQYIVLEGNRRVCALQLLNDPDKSPQGSQSYFKKLVDDGSAAPSKIDCICFDKRQDANLWLERRHKGEQNGIGTRNWTAKQQARHSKNQGNSDPNAAALSLLDYGTSLGIKNIKEKMITTVTRYVSNPFFRKTVGITSGSRDYDLKLNVPIDEFERVITKFFSDIHTGEINVGSRTSSEERESYAKQLIHEGYTPTTYTGIYKLSDGEPANDNQDDEINDSKGKKGGSKNPGTRKYIIPIDFKPSLKDKFLIRCLQDLRNIHVDNRPLPAALTLRVFLERVYFDYCELVNSSKFSPGTKANQAMTKAISFLDADTKKKHLNKNQKRALTALKKVNSSENNILSPKTLGTYAHGGMYPVASELKIGWDNISAIVEYMLDEVFKSYN